MSFSIRAALVMFAALAWAASASAQNPIEAEVKASLKDTTKPFALVVTVKVKDGEAQKFEAAFAKARAITLKEKGCKAYDLNRSGKSPAEFLVYERWLDLASLQAHLKAQHFIDLIADVHELFDGPPEIRVFVPAAE